MIRFDAIAECGPSADTNGASDRRPPDHPTAAVDDGGDNLPPNLIVHRDGDGVRLTVEIDGGEIIVTLTRSNARALGAALAAASGSAFHHTRT
jgi:hypothetical protein